MRHSGSPVAAPPTSPSRGRREPRTPRPRARPPSILVVDARVADRRHLAALLRLAGYGTREETDGAGALARAREERPDLVIVGTLAAGMGAEEFTGHLRAEESLRRVPVLLHSSSRRDSDAKPVDDGSGLIPVAAMCSDPAAVLDVVARLFGRPSSSGPGFPAAPAREPAPAGVPLPTLPLAAFLADLRSFHEEVGHLLDERGRAPGGSPRRMEAMLGGIRARIASFLEHGTAIAAAGEAGAPAAALPGAPGTPADPPFKTVTLGNLAPAGTGTADGDHVAGPLPLLPGAAPAAGQVPRFAPSERPRDGEAVHEEPITFAPADITAFTRIVEAWAARGDPDPGSVDPDAPA